MNFEIVKNYGRTAPNKVTIRKSGAIFIPNILIEKYTDMINPPKYAVIYSDKDRKLIAFAFYEEDPELPCKKLIAENFGVSINILAALKIFGIESIKEKHIIEVTSGDDLPEPYALLIISIEKLLAHKNEESAIRDDAIGYSDSSPIS